MKDSHDYFLISPRLFQSLELLLKHVSLGEKSTYLLLTRQCR